MKPRPGELSTARATLIKAGSHIGVGIDNQKPRIRVEQRVGAIFEMIDVYAHNHGYAARPGKNGNMATRASPAQYNPPSCNRSPRRSKAAYRRPRG